MLILTRKAEQDVFIGQHIRILVTELRGGQVKLGIEAPPGTLILRGEVMGDEEKQLFYENAQGRQFRRFPRNDQRPGD